MTISGDDLSLLKAQSFVFAKMAETSTSLPANAPDFERIFLMRARTEVSVPTRIIGRIIGRGGQNVRELQRITGAIVKIPEEERHLDGNNPDGELAIYQKMFRFLEFCRRRRDDSDPNVR